MARLILVRHGETEWNRQLRYQGQSDIELNQTGIVQAEGARDRLAGERIDCIYSSDLKRAVKTAEIITSRHEISGGIRKSELLREMSFGAFEGLTHGEIEKLIEERYPDSSFARSGWESNGLDWAAPNGESLIQLGGRVSRFAEQLSQHNASETVLIVAHGGSLQLLICLQLGVELHHWWQVRLASCAITIMETHENGAVLTLFNDVCHL